MSGPSVRTVAPSLKEPSTLAAAPPPLAQALGRGEAVVDPADVLLGEPADTAPEILLELAQLPRRVRGQHRKRRVAQEAHRVADGVASLVPRIVRVSHFVENLLPQTIRPKRHARSAPEHLNEGEGQRQRRGNRSRGRQMT